MKIKILGTGCAKCNTLEKSTRQAVEDMKLNAEIEKVEDIVEIMKYGIMRTPALIIDEKVMMYGKSPSVKEIIEIIQKA